MVAADCTVRGLPLPIHCVAMEAQSAGEPTANSPARERAADIMIGSTIARGARCRNASRGPAGNGASASHASWIRRPISFSIAVAMRSASRSKFSGDFAPARLAPAGRFDDPLKDANKLASEPMRPCSGDSPRRALNTSSRSSAIWYASPICAPKSDAARRSAGLALAAMAPSSVAAANSEPVFRRIMRS